MVTSTGAKRARGGAAQMRATSHTTRRAARRPGLGLAAGGPRRVVVRRAAQAHRRCAVRMLCYSKSRRTQLSDVEIDRINKPELPLASGRMSVARGRKSRC